MCTYYLVSPRVVVNSHSDLYIKCATLKLVHIANFERREILYTHNKFGLRLLQLNAWAMTPNCTTPKLVPLLGTHRVEHTGIH